jgi:hypothetical protein
MTVNANFSRLRLGLFRSGVSVHRVMNYYPVEAVIA